MRQKYLLISVASRRFGMRFSWRPELHVLNNSHDQLVVEYSINGGGWILSWIYVCGDTLAYRSLLLLTNIQGNSLRIRVLAGNKANTEVLHI